MKIDLNKLELIMAQKIITSDQLAKRSNVARTTISQIFNGRTEVNPSTLGKLARSLDVNVEDLWGV